MLSRAVKKSNPTLSDELLSSSRKILKLKNWNMPRDGVPARPDICCRSGTNAGRRFKARRRRTFTHVCIGSISGLGVRHSWKSQKCQKQKWANGAIYHEGKKFKKSPLAQRTCRWRQLPHHDYGEMSSRTATADSDAVPCISRCRARLKLSR